VNAIFSENFSFSPMSKRFVFILSVLFFIGGLLICNLKKILGSLQRVKKSNSFYFIWTVYIERNFSNFIPPESTWPISV
jgi:hypothetical protein